MNYSRKLPFSYEAEQAVLGSVLLDPERFTDVAGTLDTSDFYLDEHVKIYSAIQELFVKNRTIDVVTLIDMLVKQGVYASDEASRNYVKVIAEIVPSAANIKDYAKIVKDKSLLRKLIAACEDIEDTAYTENDDVSHIMDYAGQRIFEITQHGGQKSLTHIRETIIDVYEHIKNLRTGLGESVGAPTGFTDLDHVLVGMNDSDLIIIGARPGMGKTSLAMNIAAQTARKTRKTVCVFSLEMSRDQLVTRMLSSEGLIDSHTIRTGLLSEEEFDNLAQAASNLSELPIYIDDTSGITVTGMKAKLRREKNLGLVVIDYLQLMTSEKRIENRVQEVSDISRNLKLMAKELKVPVVTCAQLSRASESRTGQGVIPKLSDLRDSGAIEQDADVVMFLYRPEYYDPEKPQNVAEIHVAKNRHGPTEKIEIGWFGQYTKFTDLKKD
jgi:replicative DNA helicase